MGDNESRRDDPEFSERGYWAWRDRLEAELEVDDPEAAQAVVRDAGEWYEAFVRMREGALKRRARLYVGGIAVLLLGALAACGIAAMVWRATVWAVVICGVLGLVAVFHYVSTVAAARAAHKLELGVLLRQFPGTATYLGGDGAQAHGLSAPAAARTRPPARLVRPRAPIRAGRAPLRAVMRRAVR
ncbi:hypothetical protein [Nocardia sp. NPDC050710]|uniref:hypothetical protein n=1 Tax=Nocardia sp. NPDC050710 TaxID=3157220 RepID=UPI003409D977